MRKELSEWLKSNEGEIVAIFYVTHPRTRIWQAYAQIENGELCDFVESEEEYYKYSEDERPFMLRKVRVKSEDEVELTVDGYIDEQGRLINADEMTVYVITNDPEFTCPYCGKNLALYPRFDPEPEDCTHVIYVAGDTEDSGLIYEVTEGLEIDFVIEYFLEGLEGLEKKEIVYDFDFGIASIYYLVPDRDKIINDDLIQYVKKEFIDGVHFDSDGHNAVIIVGDEKYRWNTSYDITMPVSEYFERACKSFMLAHDEFNEYEGETKPV